MELPEEMIVLILHRLPVKSLIRFTCVSKRFHSMILSDPKFAKSQFQATREQRRLLVSVKGPPEVVSIDFETFAVTNLKFPLDPEPAAHNVSLLGSRNGIVFFTVADQEFFAWNPSTGFLMDLPDTGFVEHDRDHAIFYGVGYLQATDDYRVFVAYSNFDGTGDFMDDGAVFSSRANAWKTLEFNELNVTNFEGAFLHDALHWLDYKDEIVAFDLAQEEDHKFRKMLLPKGFKDDDDGRYFRQIELSAGECLVLARFLSSSSQHIHVWVLREYDVPDSWTKLFNLKFQGPVDNDRWSYTPNNSIVMENTTIFTIIVGDKKECVLVKILHTGDECSFCKFKTFYHVRMYQESLLQIDE